MTKKYRYLSVSSKRAAVGRVLQGEAVSTVARSIGVDRKRLYEWRDKYQVGGAEAVRRAGRPGKAEALHAQARARSRDELSAAHRRIAELERKIGEQQVDLDFFRRALRHIEEGRPAPAVRGAVASTKPSRR
jgi:transposase-like protein